MWKLKDEDMARLFTREMAAKDDDVNKADDVQKKWLLMKETLLKGSKQVCRMTKGLRQHKETCGRGGCQEKGMSIALMKSKSTEDINQLF